MSKAASKTIAGIIVTGFSILLLFIGSLPDNKLHITVCDVGQGDSMYIRFPDGRDMLVDGGPSDAVLSCLNKAMPFWDHELDMVLLTHPESDHLRGIVTVLKRYAVGVVLRSGVDNTSTLFSSYAQTVVERKVKERFVRAGDVIDVSNVALTIVWPSTGFLTSLQPVQPSVSVENRETVLGATTGTNFNDQSVVFWLKYGQFDMLFTGDADTRVEGKYKEYLARWFGDGLANNTLELLKIPHHGSRTGMTEGFLSWLHPAASIISVGKNSYGHPSKEILSMIAAIGSRVYQTQTDGSIEVVSDGNTWKVLPDGKN